MVTIAGAEDRQRPPVRRQGGDQQVRHDGGEWRCPTGGFKIEDGDANNGKDEKVYSTNIFSWTQFSCEEDRGIALEAFNFLSLVTFLNINME